MATTNPVDELVRRIMALLPGHGGQLQADVASSVRSLLQHSLSKLNLVTREEFDLQSALLARTREKLELLQAQLHELENQADSTR